VQPVFIERPPPEDDTLHHHDEPPPPPPLLLPPPLENEAGPERQWQSEAATKLLPILECADDHYYMFGKDTVQIFKTIREFPGRRMPAIYSTHDTQHPFQFGVSHGGKTVPTAHFVRSLTEALSTCYILATDVYFSHDERYGDLLYAVYALAAWNGTAEEVAKQSKEELLDSLPDALQRYIQYHFENMQESGQTVVFKPPIEKFQSAINKRIDINHGPDAVSRQLRSHTTGDFHKYLPPSYVDGESHQIKYPDAMYMKSWPVVEIIAARVDSTFFGIGPWYANMYTYAHIWRYTAWGMAVLALLYTIIGDKKRFRQDIIETYLKRLSTNDFRRLTTSHLFPGLYAMLILSRPDLDVCLHKATTIALDGKHVVAGISPPALKPFLLFYCCVEEYGNAIDVERRKKSSLSQAKLKMLDNSMNDTKDILQQFLEHVLIEAFKHSHNSQSLADQIVQTAYNDVFKTLGTEAKTDYIKTGFIYSKTYKHIDPKALNALKSVAQASINRQSFENNKS